MVVYVVVCVEGGGGGGGGGVGVGWGARFVKTNRDNPIEDL